MPFTLGFQIYPWVERILRLRGYPLAAYGAAVALVAVGVLLRWLIGEYVGARIPFITFFPAIVVATLVGGLGPGIAAIVLSTLSAWYLFVPPYYSLALGERELAQLLVFVGFGGIEMAVAAVLNALVERLVKQQRNIRLLLESAPNGFVLVDAHGTIKLVNASAEKLFGYSRTELAGKDVEVLVPGQHVEDHRKQRVAYHAKPEVRVMGLGRDLSGRRKDGSEFPVEIGLNPVGRDDQPAVLATVVDISARKLAEKHQRLMISELEHRTRNLFAVLQAIIHSTLKEAKTVTEAASVLGGRVTALSNAYALLTDAAWEGASLAHILKRQLVIHASRITVDGCEITVVPRAAQQFAMIVHELTTNALKYGALSAPEGRIAISGSIDRHNGSDVFVFSWKESGGPRVSPPTRRGFGSVILHEAAQQFGDVALDYRREGLNYLLRVDLTAIEVPKKPAARPERAAQTHAVAR